MNHNEQAVSLFNKLADSYAERFMNVDMYADGFEFLLQQLNPGASLLDVACGPGNITRYLLNKRSDLLIHGIEMAPRMVELARQNNPKATFSLHDAQSLHTLTQRYDAIVTGFLFPYLNEEAVKTYLNSAFKQLNEGGLLYISTIEDEYQHSGLQSSSTGEQLMQYFYTGDWLKKELKISGFDILNENRVRYSDKDQKPITDVILISKR